MNSYRLSIFRFLIISLGVFFLFLGSCDKSNQTAYRIGFDALWYPLDLVGREKNIEGFSNDLLQEIAKIKKIQISIVQLNWDNVLSSLEKDKVDGILSSMPPYSFYEGRYDFSDRYLSTGPVLVVPFQSKSTSLMMMKGKEIAIVTGSPAVRIVERVPEIIIRNYDSIPAALNDVVAGVVDGAVIDILPARGYTNDLYRGQLKIASPPLNDEGLRLVTLHDNATQLIKDFNKGLTELRSNGKYTELVKKWSLSD